MKIKTYEIMFVEVLGTLPGLCLLDHFSKLCSLQATLPGANDMSEFQRWPDVHWYRFYLSHLLFSLMEMQIFYLRIASSVARLEMGSGVASILLPKKPLTSWLRGDSLSSFPPRIIHRWVSGMRGELP